MVKMFFLNFLAQGSTLASRIYRRQTSGTVSLATLTGNVKRCQLILKLNDNDVLALLRRL